MTAAETIALIRDLFIIVFCGLGIIAFLAVTIAGFMAYRTVKRAANRVERLTDTVRNQVVMPLTRVTTLVSVVTELVSRLAGRMQRRQTQEERRSADAESSRSG